MRRHPRFSPHRRQPDPQQHNPPHAGQPTAAGELPCETMEIDYLLLAEHAEIQGNKLYLMGGGWDTMHVAEAPANVRLMVAAGVRIDWAETGGPLPLVLRIDDEDAQEVFRINGQMNFQRPANAIPGSTQLSQMTFAVQTRLKALGGYRITLSAGVEGAEVRRSIPFRLAQAQQRPTG